MAKTTIDMTFDLPGYADDHTPQFEALACFLMNTAWEKGMLNGMTREDAMLAAKLARLHDLGKILLPQEIRFRSGSLTPEEYKIMRRHAVWGEALAAYFLSKLRGTSAFTYATEICLHHHERWDGGGYPDGLKGNEIPAHIQVVSLADAYDALIAPRTYKPPLDHETAVRLILSDSCGVFSPWMQNLLTEHAPEIKSRIYAPPED